MLKNLLLFGLISVVFLSGCITIHEKYHFNKNGSGTMEYIIDMNELFTLMKSFSEKEQPEDFQVDQTFLDAAEALKSVKGVSNIVLTGNSKEYIFGIKYDFKDINTLNEAMGVILKQESKKNNYVSHSRKKITRHGIISEEFSKEKLMGEDEGEVDMEMMKGVFEQMNYKVSMNFYRKVKSVDSHAAYLITNKNTTFETNFGKLIDNRNNLETTIILK